MLNLKLCGLVGCIMASICATFYVFLSKERKKQKRVCQPLCPGLINTGNSCFLNSILQALASSNNFKTWLCEDRNQEQPYGSLQCALSSSIKALNEESIEHCGKYYNPKSVVNALQTHGYYYSIEQKDAYEYYNILLQALEDETCKQISTIPMFQLNSLTKSTHLNDSTFINYDFKQSIESNNNVSDQKEMKKSPFHGTILTQLECRYCGNKLPLKQEKFSSITLNIPSISQELITVDVLLQRHFMLESIDNLKCDVCKTMRSFILRSFIGKMPKSLCLHIQRTSWSEYAGAIVKNYQAVTFSEFLSLQPFSFAKVLVKKYKQLAAFPLVGGKTNFSEKGSIKSKHIYSQVVYRLKALNYLKNSKFTGISAIATIYQQKDSHKSISPQHPLPPISELQSWSKAYNNETIKPVTIATDHSGSLYRLVSVVSHLGDAGSGHFIAYRRTRASVGLKFSPLWVRTSDCDVTPARISDVLSVSPYMLIYDTCS